MLAAAYEYSEEYRKHIIEQSPEWRRVSRNCLQAADYRCQMCNASGVTLHAHHRTYESIGGEQAGDLTCVCVDCHELFKGAKQFGAPQDIVAALKEITAEMHKPNSRIEICTDPFTVYVMNPAENICLEYDDPRLQSWLALAVDLTQALANQKGPQSHATPA